MEGGGVLLVGLGSLLVLVATGGNSPLAEIELNTLNKKAAP